MIFLLFVVLFALAAGFAAGGRLRNFEQLRLRAWWLAPVGLLLQVQLPALWHPSRDLSVAMLIVSYVLLLVFAALNIRLAGFALIFIGLAMNLTVVSVNGGMPVTKSALVASGQGSFLPRLVHGKAAKHHLARPDDVLLPLADVIAIPPPIEQVVSAGDLVVYAGVIWLVVATMRGRPRAWVRLRPKREPARLPDGQGLPPEPRERAAGLPVASTQSRPGGELGEGAGGSPFIMGDLEDGPAKPAVVLKLSSLEAVYRLRRVFLDMMTTEDPVLLNAQPGAAFREFSVELVRQETQPAKQVLGTDDNGRRRFMWTCSAEEWKTCAWCLDPFLDGKPGRRYLTDGGDDDAIIVVSVGESGF